MRERQKKKKRATLASFLGPERESMRGGRKGGRKMAVRRGGRAGLQRPPQLRALGGEGALWERGEKRGRGNGYIADTYRHKYRICVLPKT